MKAHERFWDGDDTHPLLATLGVHMQSSCFSFSGYRTVRGDSAALWRRPAFNGCERQIEVASHTREAGFGNARSHLCVISRPRDQVAMALALDDCDRCSGYREPPTSKPPLTIASMDLN